MPKKTLILLVSLILVTVVLFLIALQTGKQQMVQKTAVKTEIDASPTPDVAHTILSMSPNPLQVATGKTGSVDVLIDPYDNPVTGIQFELLYDPSVLSNVKIVPGPLFTNANVLLNKNNATDGTYTYAYGLLPGQSPIVKKGVAATITFTARGALGKQSQIIIQPDTLVTARGVAPSVLKEATGVTIVISSPTKATTTQTQTKVTTSTPAAAK